MRDGETSLELPDDPPGDGAGQSAGDSLPPAPDTTLVLPEDGEQQPIPASAEPVPSPPTGPLGNLVAAHLQRVEIAMLGRVLATTLAGALPPSMVRVEWRHGLGQRLSRKPGTVVGVTIAAGERTLTFRVPAVGVTETTISHTVRGVTLSSTQVPVAQWLDELSQVLNRIADEDAATRAALQQALLN